MPEDFLGNFLVSLKILSVDQNVVDVDTDDSVTYEVPEDVIHHSLKYCWGIGQTQHHDDWLIEFSVSPKGSLPFISFLYPDILVSQPDTDFCKIPSFLELSD